MDEFGSGVSALKLIFTLKFQHWQGDVWTIYRTPVLNRVIAKDALRAILQSTSSHARIQEFQQEEPAIKSFLDGTDLFEGEVVKVEMQGLATLMGAARWAWTLEWLGEGEHARTRKDTRQAPKHSERFVSFCKRWVEMQAYMEASVDNAHRFAECLDQVAMGRRISELLGLKNHPALSNLSKKDLRSVLHKVIYHAHPSQLYTSAPPVLCREQEFRARVIPDDVATAQASFISSHCSHVWRKHAIEHILQLIHEHDGKVFSLVVKSGALNSLKNMLHGPQQVGSSDEIWKTSAPDFEAELQCLSQEGFPPGVANMLFFKTLLQHVDQMQRARPEKDTVLLKSDVAVECHTLVKVVPESKLIAIDAQPATFVNDGAWDQDSAVLSLDMFTLDELEHAWLWNKGNVEFHLDMVVALEAHEVPDEAIDAMPKDMVVPPGLVSALRAENHGFHSSPHCPALWQEWLMHLEGIKFVERTDGDA